MKLSPVKIDVLIDLQELQQKGSLWNSVQKAMECTPTLKPPLKCNTNTGTCIVQKKPSSYSSIKGHCVKVKIHDTSRCVSFAQLEKKYYMSYAIVR